MHRNRRRPLLAFIYAALSAFLGMLYVGRSKRALIYLVLELACFVVAKIGSLYGWWPYSPVAAVSYFLVKTVGIVDTYRIAREYRHEYDGPWYSFWYGAPLFFGLIAIAAVLGKTVFFEPVVITGNSMAPELLRGDYVLGYKWPYQETSLLGFEPPWLQPPRQPVIQRGDVILFKFPDDPRQIMVKRVIGLPGDHIIINRNAVVINNIALKRHKIMAGSQQDRDFIVYEETAGDNTYRIRYSNVDFPHSTQQFFVPKNTYFVLGDNRDHSYDSRYWTNSFVLHNDVIGEPLFIWWSEKESFRAPIRWSRLGDTVY